MVGKPAATVMTSSPGLSARSPSLGEVSAVKASRLADEPELAVSTCCTPRKARQALLEGVVEAAGGEPAVQRGLDHQLELGRADDLAGRAGSRSCPGSKPWAPARLGVLLDQFGDLQAQRFGSHADDPGRHGGVVGDLPSGKQRACPCPAARRVPLARCAPGPTSRSQRGAHPSRVPRLGAVQLQEAGLVWVLLAVSSQLAPSPQRCDHALHDPLHRPGVLVGGAEVPGLRIRPGRRRQQRLGQRQIAGQRLEHVLPRADGMRVADDAPARRCSKARRMSGTRRSSAQSPPPMTLPARADGHAPRPSLALKNERR